MTAAYPCPTPMHKVTRPYRPPVRFNSLAAASKMRDPVMPRGCPSAMAPPLGLIRASSSSNSTWMHAKLWAANASLAR